MDDTQPPEPKIITFEDEEGRTLICRLAPRWTGHHTTPPEPDA